MQRTELKRGESVELPDSTEVILNSLNVYLPVVLSDAVLLYFLTLQDYVRYIFKKGRQNRAEEIGEYCFNKLNEEVPNAVPKALDDFSLEEKSILFSEWVELAKKSNKYYFLTLYYQSIANKSIEETSKARREIQERVRDLSEDKLDCPMNIPKNLINALAVKFDIRFFRRNIDARLPPIPTALHLNLTGCILGYNGFDDVEKFICESNDKGYLEHINFSETSCSHDYFYDFMHEIMGDENTVNVLIDAFLFKEAFKDDFVPKEEILHGIVGFHGNPEKVNLMLFDKMIAKGLDPNCQARYYRMARGEKPFISAAAYINNPDIFQHLIEHEKTIMTAKDLAMIKNKRPQQLNISRDSISTGLNLLTIGIYALSVYAVATVPFIPLLANILMLSFSILGIILASCYVLMYAHLILREIRMIPQVKADQQKFDQTIYQPALKKFKEQSAERKKQQLSTRQETHNNSNSRTVSSARGFFPCPWASPFRANSYVNRRPTQPRP